MSGFTRSMRRKKAQEDRGRAVKAAEQAVIERLERRWKDQLPRGHIPQKLLAKLRRSELFRELVRRKLNSDAIALPDRDYHPRYRKNEQTGEVYDMLIDELGGDPRLYHCVECSAEISAGERLCSECRDFANQMEHDTGVRP